MVRVRIIRRHGHDAFGNVQNESSYPYANVSYTVLSHGQIWPFGKVIHIFYFCEWLPDCIFCWCIMLLRCHFCKCWVTKFVLKCFAKIKALHSVWVLQESVGKVFIPFLAGTRTFYHSCFSKFSKSAETEANTIAWISPFIILQRTTPPNQVMGTRKSWMLKQAAPVVLVLPSTISEVWKKWRCQLSALTYFISFEHQHLYIRRRHITLLHT